MTSAACLMRTDHLRIGAAPAQVPAHCHRDLVVRRIRVFGQQRGRGEHLPRGAEAALHRIVGDERLLKRMNSPGGADPLDGGDVDAVARRREGEPRIHRAPIDSTVHARIPPIADELRAGELRSRSRTTARSVSCASTASSRGRPLIVRRMKRILRRRKTPGEGLASVWIPAELRLRGWADRSATPRALPESRQQAEPRAALCSCSLARARHISLTDLRPIAESRMPYVITRSRHQRQGQVVRRCVSRRLH